MKKVISLTFIILISCEDSIDQTQNSNLLFIASEGTYGNGDGSISVYSENEKIQTINVCNIVTRFLHFGFIMGEKN